MEHYPTASYKFKSFFVDQEGTVLDTMFYPDGSASVHVTVSINELKRSMWLPVMDFKNNAIANPNSRQISDAKMRCLVKCIAMFGLAHYVFAGEDLPPSSDDEEETEQPEQAEQAEEETKETEEELPVNYKKFSESLIETATKMEETVSGLESLWKSNKDTIKELKAKDEELYQKLVRSFAERRSQMENATEEVATEKGDKEDD